MSKHTPGEWAVVEDRVPGSLEVFANGRAIAICEVWRRTKPETERANARLIAAAPELLEALKVLLSGYIGSQRDIEQAMAAIAKAEGEKQ